MVSFQDALKNAAKGHTTVQGEKAPTEKVEKAADKKSLAGILKKTAQTTAQTTVVGTKAAPTRAPTPKVTTKASLKDALASASAQAKKMNEPLQMEDFVFDTGPVAVWAFSSLKNYESCPYQVKLAKVDKIKQEDSPAAERGSAIHLQCEDYIQGITDSIVGDAKTKMGDFQELLDDLRDKFTHNSIDSSIQIEENWGIRKDWSPCDWDDDELWGRAKLDVFLMEGKSCEIIDWKTGRKFGNEFKHSDQGISYALYAAFRYPHLERFKVRFAYLDQGESMVKFFTRQQLIILQKRFHERARKMTSEKEFAPKPNMESCRFCPYGCNKNKQGRQYGNGHCEFDHYREAGTE